MAEKVIGQGAMIQGVVFVIEAMNSASTSFAEAVDEVPAKVTVISTNPMLWGC